MKSFCGCFTGPDATRGGFLEKSPPGRRRQKKTFMVKTSKSKIERKLSVDLIILIFTPNSKNLQLPPKSNPQLPPKLNPVISTVTPQSPPMIPPMIPPVAPPVTPPVTPSVKKLLELFSENKILGNQRIRELLGVKDRKNVRKYYIIPAMELGAIEYTIPDKPKSRNQKYKLTSIGRKILMEINRE